MRSNAERVLISPASKCTCGVLGTNLTSQRSDPNCPACHGWGFVYGPKVTVRGIVSEYDIRKNPLDLGIMQPGDMMLAVVPREPYWINTYDLAQFPDWEHGDSYEGELVIRSQGLIDTVRYPIVRIARISTTANTGVTTYYQAGTDYTFTRLDGHIHWLAGRGPAPGSVYAVNYSPLYEWVVFNPPNPRYARGTDVGQRVALRRREVPQTTPDY